MTKIDDDESTNEACHAMVKFNEELDNIQIPKNRQNHNKGRYADLAVIMKKIRPALTKHGLYLTHRCAMVDGVLTVTTIISHPSSDVHMSCDIPIFGFKEDPQGIGSAITYARRYGVCALLAIVADDDDDANLAMPENNGSHRQGKFQEVEPEPTKHCADLMTTYQAKIDDGQSVESMRILYKRINNIDIDEESRKSLQEECKKKGDDLKEKENGGDEKSWSTEE